eukprot:TRINITY_DN7493_c0_g2_i5.p1 TRINITY_DN7493_c0_g2~~TRINITY_DN7493_c0_g2_i5.p1  ORF type:complete len:449 (-),score=70.31 TRINITY_DN7493_c0_g2_i5:62-1408(-)
MMIYAIDAICLPKYKSDAMDYVLAFQPLLPEIFTLACEDETCKTNCHRVLTWWHKRNLLPKELVEKLMQIAQLNQHTQEPYSSWIEYVTKLESEVELPVEQVVVEEAQVTMPSPRPVKDKEVDQKEHERRSILAYMEELHHSQKRRRLENCLRPESETEMQEFNELLFEALLDHMGEKSYDFIDQLDPCMRPKMKEKVVCLWDLDETLIIFQSILPDKDYRPGSGQSDSRHQNLNSTAYHMENLIYDVCDDYLNYRKVDDYPAINIMDLVSRDSVVARADPKDDVNKPSISVDEAREIYQSAGNVFKEYRTAISRDIIDRAVSLCKNIDALKDGWIANSVSTLTKLTSQFECEHIIVSNTWLVPTFAKLILYGLAPFFDVANVYSSATAGKVECFKRIKSRFPKAKLFAIGNGEEERLAAQDLRIPFHRIQNSVDLLGVPDWIQQHKS